MSFDQFSAILSSNLFLQTPIMAMDENAETPSNPYDQISEKLDNILHLDSISSKDLYALYMSVANSARDLIIEFDKIRDYEDLYTVLQLWNVRLTTLVCANELSVAQKESKRLSVPLETISKAQNTAAEENSLAKSTKNFDTFPRELPLSLKILILRLKTPGPSTTLNSEYFKLLTDTRLQYTIYEEELEASIDKKVEKSLEAYDVRKLGEALAYAVSGNLIAKREYLTLLTHADSIITPLEDTKDEKEVIFRDKMSMVAMLVSLINGELEIGRDFVKDGDVFKILLNSLTYILNNVDPVLDYKKRASTERKKDYEIDDFPDLEQVFELVKEQAITGRILCSLSALFELQTRDNEQDGCDIFDKPTTYKYPRISYQVFKLWFKNTSKLYGFE